MTKGSYSDFRDALLAFESGWDLERYNAGVIQDWQLDQWAGGTVSEIFPQYTSWSQLSESEWSSMAYSSTNSLGFVGYQFGEALLIDLGYYQDDFYYGNGASSNTWDGTWTGKNGVNSLDDFKTGAAQERAIQEAFGFNLNVIETGLGDQGQSLDDFLGTTRTYVDNGESVTVELTLSGIMAAAHLRGAWGTLKLLQNGTVSADEYGTSILRYVDQFGGYSTPSVPDVIAAYTEGKFPDGTEVPSEPTDPPTDSDPASPVSPPMVVISGNGTANVTAETADVVVDWAWGTDARIEGFDPAVNTIFISWITADTLEVSEVNGSAVFSIPSNNQSTTLVGVQLADLSGSNFTILDDSAAAEVLALIGHDMPMEGTMYMITLDTPAQVITGFDATMDMLHIEPDVTADRFNIFEESGTLLGQTVRIELLTDTGLNQIVLTDIGLSDLSLANFNIADQGVFNEVTAAIGAVVTTPGDGQGYTLSDDADGSNPAAITGQTDAGGVKWRADTNADDIWGLDPTVDEIDIGGTSVHGMIITKSPEGEIVIDSPWSDAAQIVQGVTFADVDIDFFGTVGNEHFRQDIGGVMSWEKGIGPREADTYYMRSHEYGVHEVIDGFDPASDKISFLYFGTRERLSVEDTDQGLKISSLPTGQSFTFTDVTLADLRPGLVEFHHDQVIEDNLEVAFGFDQELVTLVSRSELLTPAAPAGATTDGLQTRIGDIDGDGIADGDPTTVPPGPSVPPESNGNQVVFGEGADTLVLDWSWGETREVVGFDPSEDVIDFGSFSADQLSVTEVDGSLVIEVLGNGGDFDVIKGLQAEDLTLESFQAPSWSSILDQNSELMANLGELGF